MVNHLIYSLVIWIVFAKNRCARDEKLLGPGLSCSSLLKLSPVVFLWSQDNGKANRWSDFLEV